MTAEKPSTHRRLPKFIRIVRARPRLMLCGLIGLVAIALLPTEWRLVTRMLVGWDIGVGLYAVAAFHVMARADVGRIRRRAALQDEGQVALLVLVVAAALASLGAIIAQLGSGRTPAQLALATVTILLSWALIHIIFALHYAHEFYSPKDRGG